MKKILTLGEVLDIGGSVSIYRKNGSTNSISLSKLLRDKRISFKKEVYLVYLKYSNTPKIQAVYLVSNPNDRNCKLKEVYNKLNEF